MAFPRDRVQQLAFISILLVLGGLILYELRAFMSGFLGALTLYVLLRPGMLRLTERERYRWPKPLAAVCLLLLALVVLIIPMGLIVEMLYSKISGWAINMQALRADITSLVARLHEVSGFELVSDKLVSGLQGVLGSVFTTLLSSSYSLVMNLMMLCFFLYFMLTNTRWLDRQVENVLPLSKSNAGLLMAEIQKMVMSNAVGIPLIALIQGLVASLGYAVFGVQNPVFWGMITGFMSILPLVGTTIIWLPMCIYLGVTGMLWQCLGLVAYSLLIITNADNLIRFILQKKMADVHPLVTVLGVIIGISLFGFLGIIFGPLLISAFLLLYRMYRKAYMADEELRSMEKEYQESNTP
jgi:Predicted permease